MNVLAGIIIFSSLSFLIACLEIAILKPSRATIFNVFSFISTNIPVITPLDSSILAENEVFLIISLRISFSNKILLSCSSFEFNLGNSSDGQPTILNSEFEHLIITFPSSSSTVIISFGSFLIISPKSFACTTISPFSELSTSKVFSIPRSRSDADIVRVPSSFTLRRIPLRIGIVVLDVTAFDTIFNDFANVCWLQENFI